MEKHDSSLRVLAIIQARVDSSRLPKKVLMKINNKTIIEYVVSFLKQAKLIDKIVIATTNLADDDEIERLSNKLGIGCFRGSPDDVLNRFYECSKYYKGDIIVRITADDPLIDPNIVDEMIYLCKKSGCDYASNVLHQTFPLGFTACEAFTFPILKKLNQNVSDSFSREHVTHHIRKNPQLYYVEEVIADPFIARPNWRLTIDYLEDFQLIKEIIIRLYKEGGTIPYKSIVDLLDKNKELLKINAKHSLLY